LIAGLEGIQKIQDDIRLSISGVVKREQALALMLREIQDDLKKRGIEIIIAENGTVLRIPEKQLHFDLGKFRIPIEHTESANAIGEVLLKSLRQDQNRSLLDTVFVEGHTDSVPNKRAMGNWGLSTYRAISLWKFWTESPGKMSELKELRTNSSDSNHFDKVLISVSGYADTRSTHDHLNGIRLKDDRPEDRRIDIRFTLISSEKKDLKRLQDSLGKLRDKTAKIIQKLKETE
jgi:flagellar motor protein MotB